MNRTEVELVKVYTICKQSLRELSNLEKLVNHFLRSKLMLDIEQGLSYQKVRKANLSFKTNLEKLGFKDLDDNEKIIDQYQKREEVLFNPMKKLAKNSVPINYKVRFCTPFDHYDGPIAEITEAGYIHISIKPPKGKWYCASPYGYVYRNQKIYGRILKNGQIKTSKVGRYGNFTYL